MHFLYVLKKRMVKMIPNHNLKDGIIIGPSQSTLDESYKKNSLDLGVHYHEITIILRK